MGGDWHDLGGGLTDDDASGVDGFPGVSLQPLAQIDDPDERKWASEWLGQILVGEGVTLTPEVKSHLWSALNSLASSPCRNALSGLVALLQSNALKQALAHCLGGPMAACSTPIPSGWAMPTSWCSRPRG
jgi:type IV secretion system protein VirB4